MQKRRPAPANKRPQGLETKSRSLKTNRNRLKKYRILLIQEENIIGELLSQLLFNKGCWVDKATSALEGLRKIKRRKFNLVIADSGISDLAKTRFIRKSKEINKKISVALLDGSTKDNGAGGSNNPSIDLVIQKPLDVNMVVKKVLGVLMAGD